MKHCVDGIKHTIEYDCKCYSCSGTGLYVGIAEHDGAAVVCYDCKGTGLVHKKIEYEDFEGRVLRTNIDRVFYTSCGIVIGIGRDKQYKLKDFGGMPYKEWFADQSFPEKSEMRLFTCPQWYYQSADYEKKPDFEECKSNYGGAFSGCASFPNKEKCWERFDKEPTP